MKKSFKGHSNSPTFHDLQEFKKEYERLVKGWKAQVPNDQRYVRDSVRRIEASLKLDEGELIYYGRGGGEKNLLRAEHVYEKLNEIENILLNLRYEVQDMIPASVIRVGMRAVHWHWIFKEWFMKIADSGKGKVKIRLISAPPKSLSDMLSREELDICVIYDSNEMYTGYDEHQLGHQPMRLLAHLPEIVEHIPNVNDVSHDKGYHYISVSRDQADFNNRKGNYFNSNSFYKEPYFRFTETSIAWDYFKDTKGAVGFFSQRKYDEGRKENGRIVNLDDEVISRNLAIYYKEHVKEVNTVNSKRKYTRPKLFDESRMYALIENVPEHKMEGQYRTELIQQLSLYLAHLHKQ